MKSDKNESQSHSDKPNKEESESESPSVMVNPKSNNRKSNSNSTRTSKSTRKRHGACNQHRHKNMVKWIVKTFPKAASEAKEIKQANENVPLPASASSHARQCHILDIAGGKGELSARMTLCHTLRVQMVDPRPADLYDCFQKHVYRSLPQKWQQRIDAQDPSAIQAVIERRFQQLIKCFPMDGSDILCEVQKDEALLEAVEGCSLMIGMHADGATEAIVDIALHYRKPFVVVPCCVFPNLFRHRLVPAAEELDVMQKDEDEESSSSLSPDDPNESNNEGEEESSSLGLHAPICEIEKKETQIRMVPVRNHEQFCRYLALKDSHFVVEILPFEGRNTAIWWDGLHTDRDNGVDD